MSYIDLSESYAEIQAKCQEQHEQLALFKKKSDEQEKRIRQLEAKQLALKEILTFEEGSEYTGISKSTLYKMTSAHEIPYYKPHGKLIFFERKELDCWLRQKTVKSMVQLQEEAERAYLTSSFNHK